MQKQSTRLKSLDLAKTLFVPDYSQQRLTTVYTLCDLHDSTRLNLFVAVTDVPLETSSQLSLSRVCLSPLRRLTVAQLAILWPPDHRLARSHLMVESSSPLFLTYLSSASVSLNRSTPQNVIAGLAALVALLVASYVIKWYRQHQTECRIMASLPQPPSFPIIGHILHIKRATFHEYILEHNRRIGHGKNFGLWLGPLPTIVITDARDLHFIVSQGQQHFVKGHSMKRIFGSALPHSIFITDGEEWKAQHAAFAPSFHFASVRQSLSISIRHASSMCDVLERCSSDGTVADMNALFESTVLNILGEFSFGYRFDALRDEPLRDAIKQSMKHASLQYDPFRRLRLAARRRGEAAVRTVFDTVRRVRKARIETGVHDSACDLMALLIRAEQSGAEWMTKYTNGDSWPQYLGVVLSVMFAGSDTTTSTLCSVVYFLARHAEQRARVQAELDAYFIDPLSIPTGDEGAGLPYLTAVLKETLRLRGPAGFVGRRSVVELTLPSGLTITPSCNLVTSWQMAQINPLLWGDDASCFRPERWLEDDLCTSRKQPHVDASLPLSSVYMPFGGGKRVCIGQQFARLEMVTVLAMVLRRFDVTVPEETKHVEPAFLTTIASTYEQGLPVRVTRRYQAETRQ